MLKENIAVILYNLVQNEVDEALVSFDDCKQSFNPWVSRVIFVVADDIARMEINPETTLIVGDSEYLQGVKDEHAYIVEYLRGLLKEE